MKIQYPEKRQITKEMLPQIVERIFAICKTDSNFPLKSEMTNVDDSISSIQSKMLKQDKLLLQSKSLNKNIISRLTNLRNSNETVRERLINSLGSEL